MRTTPEAKGGKREEQSVQGVNDKTKGADMELQSGPKSNLDLQQDTSLCIPNMTKAAALCFLCFLHSIGYYITSKLQH